MSNSLACMKAGCCIDAIVVGIRDLLHQGTQIDQLHNLFPIFTRLKHDVLRLEIAIHVTQLLQIIECGQDLQDISYRIWYRKRGPLTSHDSIERFSVHILHHDVACLTLADEIVYSDDILVLYS